MVVTYIYRDPNNGGRSIEEVFKRIGAGVSQNSNTTNSFYNNADESWLSNTIKLLKNHSSNIYHITGDIQFLTSFLFFKNVILTIHDIGHYKNLTGIRKWLYGMIWFQLPLIFANKITVVSEYTSQDLLSHFWVSQKKITTIPNPVPQIFERREYPQLNKSPRILQVGTAQNKNLEGVIEALKDVLCTLIVIGELSPFQKELLQRSKIDYKNYRNLTYFQVYEQYVQAHLVIFATFHEGFGMPVIEAQSVGRPIIVSKVCSLPEVAGDGAHYVDPNNTAEIREGVQLILTDSDYRGRLIMNGVHNIKKYRIDLIVKKYEEVYRSVYTNSK